MIKDYVLCRFSWMSEAIALQSKLHEHGVLCQIEDLNQRKGYSYRSNKKHMILVKVHDSEKEKACEILEKSGIERSLKTDSSSFGEFLNHIYNTIKKRGS